MQPLWGLFLLLWLFVVWFQLLFNFHNYCYYRCRCFHREMLLQLKALSEVKSVDKLSYRQKNVDGVVSRRDLS